MSNPENFSSEILEVGDIVRSQRELLLGGFGVAASTIKTTGHDVVTKIDVEVERNLVEALQDMDSETPVYGEELGYGTKESTFWLIDPIDGTLAYTVGMPHATTMVAKIEESQVAKALIYDFVNDKLFWAERGQGAYCNESKINVSDRTLANGFVMYESRWEEDDELTEQYRKVALKSWLINYPCAGAKFIAAASGQITGVVVNNGFGYDWDYAPGSLLVEEAGGIVKNIGKYDEEFDFHDHNFIAANPPTFEELTDPTNDYL